MGSQPEVSHANPATNPATKKTFLLAFGAVVVTSAMLFWGRGLHTRCRSRV
jgi:hypothetical protein